jgi:predicted Rossmann-fold nucleotide-binding protein
MRKFWFAYLAKALMIFPGGFGTLDEMFEIVTLAQTQKLSGRSASCAGREYWDAVLDLEPLAEWTPSTNRPDLLKWVDTPEEAFEKLRAHLMTYHLVPTAGDRAPEIAKTRG